MLRSCKLCRSCLSSSFLHASRSLTCKALVFNSNGTPREVVKLVSDYPVPDVGPGDVSVDMLMCPINPADINIIQGVYAIKPQFPAVGGGEGVGVVTNVGSDVTEFSEGDWVVPATTTLGTWRSVLVAGADHFIKISKNIPVEMAATISVNPTTAYRMMKAFVPLKPGDCIIQNGANSGVGQSVIQLGAAWGINTINIVRMRPDTNALRDSLKALGATVVVTNSESAAYGEPMPQLFERYGRPILGLNCVGGRNASSMMKHLAPKSTMVTYGGMSLKPLTVGTGTLIFKDLRFVGYWNSKWLETNAKGEEHLRMMSELCTLAENGQLRAPAHTVAPLLDGQFQTALDNTMKPMIGAKQLLSMQA